VIFLCRIFESRTKPPSLTVDRSFLSQKQASISPVTLASAIIIFYPASHTIIQCIIPALKCNNHDSTIARRSREREIKNGTFLHAKYQKKKKKNVALVRGQTLLVSEKSYHKPALKTLVDFKENTYFS
jgi:hypothetical protein